jgi:tetratricopeptide (TPR) repeat protein
MNTPMDTDIQSMYAYGSAHYNSGSWEEAAKIFSFLCARRPLESNFWFALGATLQAAGNFQDALGSWAMSSLLAKEDPYPHFHAAECCFSLQLIQDAAKALAESETRIQTDPNHPLKGKITLLKEQWRL